METIKPFEAAEQYIQLRKRYFPKSWGDTMININEMILTPLITIFLLLIDKLDFMSLISSSVAVYRSWIGWMQYQELRFRMQRMYLKTMQMGGPFIVTNDPEYLPYVYADAMVRLSMRHPHSD